MKNAWKSPIASATLIILLTTAAYVPALRGGFVFDDESLITGNQMVKASDGLYRFWFTTEAADYYPLTWSFWWLEWRLWGASPMGYHVVNVLLHAANAVLVWMILERLKIPGAWLAALVFAVHPVNVATVAWISEQKNTLSMLFYALAILLYLKFDEERRQAWYVYSLGAFLLALLCKTAVVMLPVVLLGCIWWLHRRVQWKDFLCSAPFFALSLILGLVTIWFQHNRALEGQPSQTVGFASRLAAAGWVPWFYLSKAFLPLDLTVVYPKWDADASVWAFSVPGTALAACLTLLWFKRRTWGRPALFGLGYFVVTLFPVLGFFDQGFYVHSLVADHWQYYSIIGVIALLVAAGTATCRRMGQRGRHVYVTVSAAMLLVLGVATWARCCVYESGETLWRDNVAKNPHAWVAHNSLGAALVAAGKLEEAMAHYKQALRLKPDYALAHNNWGAALVQAGKIDDAIGHYNQALRLEPDYAMAHDNLGNALLQEGKLEEAIGHWEQALRHAPHYADAHNNLGNALLQRGQVTQAIAQYEQALHFEPDYAEAHYNLGKALLEVGKVSEAIGHWERAVQIKPDYANAHYNLGVALEQLGRKREAVGHFEQAVRIKPDYVEAHYKLGNDLLQEGKTEDAIGHYKQALQHKSDYAEAHNNLGIALRQAGKVQEAIKHYEQALRIEPDYAEAHCNLGAALRQVGKIEEAMGHYEQALRIRPDYAEAHYNLAVALQQTGKIREAIEHYEQAVRIKPDYAEAHNNLGGTLLQIGRAQEAIEHYEQALRLNPGSARVHYNLGVSLERVGRVQEAIGHYERALQIDPNFTAAQEGLTRLRVSG